MIFVYNVNDCGLIFVARPLETNMWTTTNFETYQKKFDFTSSGQGKPTLTALKIDGQEVFNMVELLEGEIGEDQTLQTIICEQCGIHQCASGNWVSIRQLDDFVFLLPVFRTMTDQQGVEEYEPPYYLRQRGAYWMTLSDFKELKKLVPALARLKAINRLTKFELTALYKWDTPHQLFGTLPEFQPLRKNHILVTAEVDKESAFDIIEERLTELEGAREFSIENLVETDKIVSFYLDDSAGTEWKALYKTNNEYGILLGGTFKIQTLK